MHRTVQLDDAGLNLALAGLGACLFLMLLAYIRALHHQAVCLRDQPDYFAAFSLIIAGNDFDCIASFDFHKTSGASDTIFMYPRSRSSLATGPKMRVPFGFSPSASNITAALSSKRM